MNTILVPTDFSDASLNAIEYAAKMALYTKSKIILLHIYDNTPPAIDIPVVVPAWGNMEEDCMDELKKIEKKIETNYGVDLITRSVCKYGFIVEEIDNFAKENQIDFIVMGMQGSGYIEERIIGSTTTKLMRKSHSPVISVPFGQKFKIIKKVVLACDYAELDAGLVLEPMKKIIRMFNAQLYLLHVIPEFDTGSTITERVKINSTLSGIKHTSHAIVEGNVVERINSFVIAHDVDMVVMIPRKHAFIDNIFFEPDTKRMAFHSKVPILSLHE